MNRRTVLKGAVAFTMVPTVPMIYRDPLLKALDDYHNGMAAFCALPENWASIEEEMADCDRTYGWAYDILSRWNKPAETKEGAIAALKFAKNEFDNFADSEAGLATRKNPVPLTRARGTLRVFGLRMSTPLSFQSTGFSGPGQRGVS